MNWFKNFKERNAKFFHYTNILMTIYGLNVIIGFIVCVWAGDSTIKEFLTDPTTFYLTLIEFVLYMLFDSIKGHVNLTGMQFFGNALSKEADEDGYVSREYVPKDPVVYKYWYGDMIHGMARVERYHVRESDSEILGYDCNFINQHGKVVCEDFYENCSDFIKDGIAMVKKNDTYNIVNKEGKVLSDEWFAYMEPFYKGISKVTRADRTINYLRTDGSLVLMHWRPEEIRKPSKN